MTLAYIGRTKAELHRAIALAIAFYGKDRSARIISTTIRPAHPGLRIEAEVEFR